MVTSVLWRPKFTYSRLDLSRGTFRLIRLLPPKPSLIPGCYGTVRVELIEAEIDANSKPSCDYDALSYFWGISPPNRPIIVEQGGKSYTICISRSLELALLHLAANKTTDKPLFVDQICINQANEDDEKAHQVSLMRDVYSNCDRTIVWLGTATRGSDAWFDYTRDICYDGVLSGLMGPRVSTFMEVFDAIMDASIEVTGQMKEDRDALLETIRLRGDQFPIAGYADVLDRSWFNRLWTIQEVCLAPSVIIMCGDQELCFDCFRAGALFYNIYSTHWAGQLREAKSKAELRARDAIFEKTAGHIRIFQERKAIHKLGTRQSFYDVVLKYNVNDAHRKIGASLSVDRIFGLLGLTADDDPLRKRLRVRYDTANPEAGVVSVYTEVAALLLEDNVDALLYAQPGKLTEGLPSWVPDWKMELKVPVGYMSLKEPLFEAGGPKDGSYLRVDAAAGRLDIRGVLVDEVVEVGQRTYREQLDWLVQKDVDYRWAKLFFDEAAQFVHDADATRRSNGLSRPSPDEEALTRQSQRICDSGGSHQQFIGRLGLHAGIERLDAIHTHYSNIGQRLLDSDLTVAKWHITRIYQTVGITPWYFIPAPEMDTLRICARDPVAAGRVLLQALRDFVEDVVGMCIASARVSATPYWIRLRRRYGKVNMHVSDEALAKHGLDPRIEMRSDMAAFGTSVLKNVGRRVYRTGTGYVGVGPPEMRPGDAVAVFHGSTTPHLVRRRGRGRAAGQGREGEAGEEAWRYVGEVYCDGVMHGEALTGDDRIFTLT